jgi:hypothetical protein
MVGESTGVNADYMKMLNSYKAGNVNVSEGNDINHFIPPSDQLVNNTLPDLEQIHMIDYDLSLDLRTDLDANGGKDHLYPLKFVKFGNVSRVELTSCIIPENDFLMKEPYIYVKVEELGGKCYTANHDTTFGKMVLDENKNGYLHYIPDRGSCIQNFSQPMSFQKFTMSFLNYNGKYINLKEITIKGSVILKKQNKLRFTTLYTHKLSVGDVVDIHIYGENEINSYEVEVENVVDDTTFIVDNVFEELSEHMVVLRHTINCSFKFKLYEINWNLLTKRNIQNAQLIKLSQLVSERRQEVINKIGDDMDIIKYTKTQLNPTSPGQPQPQQPQYQGQQPQYQGQQPQQPQYQGQQPQYQGQQKLPQFR